MAEILTQVQTWLALYGLSLVAALAIVVIGLMVVKYLTRLVVTIMTRAKLDQALITFVGSLTRFALIAVVVIAALNQIGFQTASLIAVLGGAVFAVGMALQSNLASLASGVLILIFQPFKLGDTIECGSVTGTVEHIDILQTRLRCADGRTVVMPNVKLTGDAVTNYSAREVMRADLVIGIGYDDDLIRAKRIVGEVLAAYPKALKEPEPVVAVLELADSSVNLAVRPYVNKDDYWQAKLDLHELIKLRFDAEGISIPYPQTDVHLHKAEPVEDEPLAVN